MQRAETVKLFLITVIRKSIENRAKNLSTSGKDGANPTLF